ncbi:DUF378 domain-containing protein [Halobacteriales archaeon SW_7_68_16]|nr:MAG: DUF378 domain-containing protein [Halobacteriales archaeon SW_7_68_16]
MQIENPLDRYSLGQVLVWSIVAIGALNWGLIAAVDTNLITDTLQLSSQNAQTVYLIVGAAAAVNLADLFTDISLLG